MKKTAEKVLSVLIVSIMLLGILPIVPFTVISKASEMPMSGTCGENVAYSFEEEKALLPILVTVLGIAIFFKSSQCENAL